MPKQPGLACRRYLKVIVSRVIVFGGSFSPPTLAHEEIIRQCLALPEFDEVWLMPSADRADKTISASEKDRLAMLQIITDRIDNPRLKICDIEYHLQKPTQLNRTVKALTKEYPSTEFTFVFGGDAYHAMPNWEGGAWLQANLSLIVFSEHDPGASNVRHIALKGGLAEVSSSQARDLIARGKTATKVIDPTIEKYIKNKHLYL